MAATILSLLMLAGLALSAGGLYLIGKKRDPKRGWLMLIAALVMFGNVAIWAMPLDGKAPSDALNRASAP